MYPQPVLATEFSEHPVADPAFGTIHPLDVPFFDSETIHAGDFGSLVYCRALMHKLFSLAHLQVMPFLRHQCALVKDKQGWLIGLQHLLENNLEVITTWTLRMKTETILVQTTTMYQEFEATKFRYPKKYDIADVKIRLKTMKTFVEQLNYLYEIKTEFLQDKYKIIDCSEMPFDQLVMIEIEKVEQLRVSLEKARDKKVLSKNNLSEQYIDNQEFILKMNISKRTAQMWRDNGYIAFVMIGSKIYYKFSDVEQMFQKNYVKPFKKK